MQFCILLLFGPNITLPILSVGSCKFALPASSPLLLKSNSVHIHLLPTFYFISLSESFSHIFFEIFNFSMMLFHPGVYLYCLFHIVLKQFLSRFSLLGSGPLSHSHKRISLLVVKLFSKLMSALVTHQSFPFYVRLSIFCFISISFMMFVFIGMTLSFISIGLWCNRRVFNSLTSKNLAMSYPSHALVLKQSFSFHF